MTNIIDEYTRADGEEVVFSEGETGCTNKPYTVAAWTKYGESRWMLHFDNKELAEAEFERWRK